MQGGRPAPQTQRVKAGKEHRRYGPVGYDLSCIRRLQKEYARGPRLRQSAQGPCARRRGRRYGRSRAGHLPYRRGLDRGDRAGAGTHRQGDRGGAAVHPLQRRSRSHRKGEKRFARIGGAPCAAQQPDHQRAEGGGHHPRPAVHRGAAQRLRRIRKPLPVHAFVLLARLHHLPLRQDHGACHHL